MVKTKIYKHSSLNFFQKIFILLSDPVHFFQQIEDYNLRDGLLTILLFLLPSLIVSILFIIQLIYNASNSGLFIQIFSGIGLTGFLMIYIIPIILFIPLLFIGAFILNIIVKLLGNKQDYKTSFNILAFSYIPILIFYIVILIPFIKDFYIYLSWIFIIWSLILLIIGIKYCSNIGFGKSLIEFLIFYLIFGFIVMIILGIILMITMFAGLGAITYYAQGKNLINDTITKSILSITKYK